MNGIIRISILCVIVFFVAAVESKKVKVIKPEIEKYGPEVKFFGNSPPSHGARQVDSTVYQTVNKYYCSLDPIIEGGIFSKKPATTMQPMSNQYLSCPIVIITGSHLMVYGNKGWTFPEQDVNLTLQYPPENKAPGFFEFIFNSENLTADDQDYIITGFKVILYIDGPESEGYINDGGVLQDTITLSFISSKLTSLSYEFWVYGARRDTPGVVELNSHYRLC